MHIKIQKWISRPLSHKVNSILSRIDRIFFYFYKLRGIHFEGNISKKDLIALSKFSIESASDYQPASIFTIKRLLEESTLEGNHFVNFLDVGCGKGFACIYVSEHYNFYKVFGFDFSEHLIDIAIRNLSKTRCKNIIFTHDDAATYQIPDGDTLVFLFNPFNEVILSNFINNNIAHFINFNSMIAY